MRNIKLVTSRGHLYTEDYKSNGIELCNQFDTNTFEDWANSQEGFQLDTETTMVKDSPTQHWDRKLLVTQLGDLQGDTQYVFDMIDLDVDIVESLIRVLESGKPMIAHNVKFEYIVLYMNLRVKIENLYDTYIISKMLNSGLSMPPGYNGLASCLDRYFNVDVSKASQTTFTGEPLTLEQIQYAADDVVLLADLHKVMAAELDHWGMLDLYMKIEREVVKAYADMEINHMRFDKKHWKSIAVSIIANATKLAQELEDEVFKDKKLVAYLKRSKKVLKVYLIQPVDEYKINWASIVFKRLALSILAPSLPDHIKTKPDLKKYLKDPSNKIPNHERIFLGLYMDRKYDKLNKELIDNYSDVLEEHGYFVKENTLLVNWASPVHKLYIFQFYYPKLKDTNAKSLARIVTNPLITKFKKWAQANKNVTTYGEGFIDNYVTPWSTIGPSGLSQILATGRVSFGILLQIPAESKFRNAFLPPKEDWVFVDTDYQSAEVLIMSHAAGEERFLDAVKKGIDLHSMSARLIYGKKWDEVADPGCVNLSDGKKCSCKEHKTMRDYSKTITFGLAYGLSPVGLSDRLDISLTEAKELFKKFFAAFPTFKNYFETNAAFAVQNLYISTPAPAHRKRFFREPEEAGDYGSIERKAKNFPIQGSSADMLKVALVILRKSIITQGMPVKLHLPIHDEILASCPKDFSPTWKTVQEAGMKKAADMFIEPGLMGVDTNILTKWAK